eukprot:5663101-Pyramimonas_sp.AAC.1
MSRYRGRGCAGTRNLDISWGAVLKPLGSLLGASGGPCGSLGATLGPPGNLLGPPGRLFGSRAQSFREGFSCGSPLGAVLGLSWAV